jgi:hypothetical protein
VRELLDIEPFEEQINCLEVIEENIRSVFSDLQVPLNGLLDLVLLNGSILKLFKAGILCYG